MGIEDLIKKIKSQTGSVDSISRLKKAKILNDSLEFDADYFSEKTIKKQIRIKNINRFKLGMIKCFDLFNVVDIPNINPDFTGDIKKELYTKYFYLYLGMIFTLLLIIIPISFSIYYIDNSINILYSVLSVSFITSLYILYNTIFNLKKIKKNI